MPSKKDTCDDKTLCLPRILCLHGGGTNAQIFESQCRVISAHLEPYFRLVFAEAPYESTPGPGVTSVYADYAPFKRWLRWLPGDERTNDERVVHDIDRAVEETMISDDKRGATGQWVALLGFSQGAKLAMSLLIRQDVRRARQAPPNPGPHWAFGVILAGRAPPVALDSGFFNSTMLCDPSQLDIARPPDLIDAMSEDHRVRVPTIHMQGLLDQGLHLHREMLEDYCIEGTTRLIEWDAAHVVALKRTDVNRLVMQILEVAGETGVLQG
ncbi:citrinin biosynthesis oxidoreductase CtnB [Seiridium cupressi]